MKFEEILLNGSDWRVEILLTFAYTHHTRTCMGCGTVTWRINSKFSATKFTQGAAKGNYKRKILHLSCE